MDRSAPPYEVTLKPKAPPAPLLQAGLVAKQVVPHGARQLTLFEDKITVRDTTGDAEALPRRYTLTHSERTGDLALSVATEYDEETLSPSQARQAWDEVLAELTGGEQPRLTLCCRSDGPALPGNTADPDTRRRNFGKALPLALAVIRYGDRFFYERHPELDQAEVMIEFEAADPRSQAKQSFGRVTDYRVTRIAGESRRLIVGAAALAAVGIGALVLGKFRNR